MLTDVLKQSEFSFLINEKNLQLPLMLSQTSAGFPSPAENFVEERIDLNVELIKNPNATFLARNGASSDSMFNAGILPGSMLIIDRNLETHNGSIVVARIEDKFTVKRLQIFGGKILLLPENENYNQIEVTTPDFEIWGKVTYAVTKL